MALANTESTYGAVTKSIHWLMALLILAAIPLGIVANNAGYDTSEQLAQKAMLFSLHKTVGVAIFFVALIRIAWALTQPKPGLLNADKPLEALLARTVHWTLYGALLLVPLTGWVHHAATEGFAPIWWPLGQSLPLVPKDDGLAKATAGLHVVFERVLVAALFLHVAGALKHHLIDRDATLRRMLPGTPAVALPRNQPAGPLPMVVAAGAFVLALAIGAALGMYSRESTAAQVAELADVETGWQVESGTLGIAIQQFGSRVAGSFSEWTAAIAFSETADADGRHGSVEVVVAIGSVTVGSVTAEALGPAYFDAAQHPTATFAADIRSTGSPGAYIAEGTLTLKGVSVPLALPFSLQIDGDTAQMQGSAEVNRLDFGIGTAETDEGNLGFAVPIEVSLTATRVTE